MESLLEGTGYRINFDALKRRYEKTTGMNFTEDAHDFYEIAGFYFVKGYNTGRSGQEISNGFQFLEETK